MEDNRLIGNTKSAIDFLGKKLEYECMGCAISNRDIEVPGGIIYEDESFMIQQDQN